METVTLTFRFPSHLAAFEFWSETCGYADNVDPGDLAATRHVRDHHTVTVTCAPSLVQYAEPNAAEFGGVRL